MPANMTTDMSHELAALAQDLAGIIAPTERICVAIGQALSDAVADLERVEADFSRLSERLSGPDTMAAMAAIDEAVASVVGLNTGQTDGHDTLTKIAAKSAGLIKRLGVLHQVGGEVGILGTNAKIQASHLTTGEADFTVFTNEMAKLATLAQTTAGHASGKVASLTDAVRQAQTIEDNFVASSGTELTQIRDRLTRGSQVLAERRRRAADAAISVRERSRQLAAGVADCIGQLQINDIAAQRVQHVREALETLDTVLADEKAADKETLTTAVCRLQQAQLERTAADYRQHVEALIANLQSMGQAVTAILGETEAAFSDDSGGQASFAGEIEADMKRASRLMAMFIDARTRTQAVRETVHSGVSGIIEDLRGISSIDADMQIMGLNATLKCGRLGNQGRALAVIAQELRACSKRTKDNGGAVGALLSEISEIANRMRQIDGSDVQKHVAQVNTAIEQSTSHLDTLAQFLDSALASLRSEGGQAARTLAETGAGIRLHEDVGRALQRVAGQLASLAGPIGTGGDVEAVRARLRELLSAKYTMASERLIHSLVTEDEMGISEPPPSEPANPTDIDDCFL